MKPCTWDSREKYELLIGPIRERAKELGYAVGVHGTLKRDIDLIACPWSSGAVDPEHLAEQIRLVVEKVIGYAQPGVREVSEYFLNGSPGAKDHGRLCWTWYLDKKSSEDCQGTYVDLSVMPRMREMHLDLVRERALTYALRADMCRTEDALEAEKKKRVALEDNLKVQQEKQHWLVKIRFPDNTGEQKIITLRTEDPLALTFLQIASLKLQAPTMETIPGGVCKHKWAHIEDHHVICELCKHTADLCWTCETEKTTTAGGALVCLKCNPQ